MMFLGFLTLLRNLMIASAPNIPRPRARLSPMAIITIAATIEDKTIAWKKFLEYFIPLNVY